MQRWEGSGGVAGVLQVLPYLLGWVEHVRRTDCEEKAGGAVRNKEQRGIA